MKTITEALTFDDVLLIPDYSEILPSGVNVSTQLTHQINLNIPLISAAMDTITESSLAIGIARLGGLGVVHKNMTAQEQALEIQAVKRFEAGVVKRPISINPETSLNEIKTLGQKHHFYSFPVIDSGTHQLCGIVTRRDIQFAPSSAKLASDIMTPREHLIVIEENQTHDIKLIKQKLHQHRIEKIIVIDDNDHLKGLITRTDLFKTQDDPNACRDDLGRLRVAGAIGVSPDSIDRAKALIQADVDALIIDTAHGHSKGVFDMIKQIRQLKPDLSLIAGNIATKEAAKALLKTGVDAVKVGIGPGSICTTRIVTGVGVPQITAIMEVAEALKGSPVKLIADGGIRFSGDIAKAMAAGAHVVMIGNLFAGTNESPGEIEAFEGRNYKKYRGMGSIAAMAKNQGSSDRYFQSGTPQDKLVPEGIEGRVPHKGAISLIIHQLVGGLRASMGYTGCADLATFREKTRFCKTTPASVHEGHVHDVAITREAPNYRTSS